MAFSISNNNTPIYEEQHVQRGAYEGTLQIPSAWSLGHDGKRDSHYGSDRDLEQLLSPTDSVFLTRRQ